MESLAGQLEDGSYYMPTFAPGASAEEQAALMENAPGKPWAIINYHNSYDVSMSMNMIRAFLANFVAGLLLCWVLLKIPNLSFKDTVLSCISIGLVGYITISYLNSVWFETDSWGYLIDSVVSLGLVGAWLGWWLNRE